MTYSVLDLGKVVVVVNEDRDDCGANAPGGGGFQKGNTCAAEDGGDSSGRSEDFGKGLSHLEDFKKMVDRIKQPDGGFTYQPLSQEEPTEGYAISIHPDRSFAADASDLEYEDIESYILKNADLLSQESNYLGAWHDPASGKVFLDVSRVTNDPSEAHELALQYDQIAYFDLGKGASVTVNPEATSGGVTNARTKAKADSYGGYNGREGRSTVRTNDREKAHSGADREHTSKARKAPSPEVNSECGAGDEGDPGFQAGNDCAKGDGSGKPEKKSAPHWTDKLKTESEVRSWIKRTNSEIEQLPEGHRSRVLKARSLDILKAKLKRMQEQSDKSTPTVPAVSKQVEWERNLKAEERKALEDWAYGELWQAVRTDSDLPEDRERVKHLRSAIDKAPDWKGTTYRATSFSSREEAIAEFKAGSFVLPDIASASKEEAVAEEFAGYAEDVGNVSVIIKAKTNHGVDIERVAPEQMADQREVIWRRGSRFKVNSTRWVGGRLHVTAEEIKPDPTINTECGAGTEGDPGFQHGNTCAKGQTDNPAFKKWFKGSKVVDDKGEPLVVYHGTDREFDEFSNPFSPEPGWSMFSESADYANHFAVLEGSHIKPVYLNIQKPFDLTHIPGRRSDARAKFIKTAKRAGLDDKLLDKILPFGRDMFQVVHGGQHHKELADHLRSHGYDGIKFNDAYQDQTPVTWVTFDSKQIKSATGNRGTFDADDPNILNSECGAGDDGDPGFQPGNTCAEGKGAKSKPEITLYGMFDGSKIDDVTKDEIGKHLMGEGWKIKDFVDITGLGDRDDIKQVKINFRTNQNYAMVMVIGEGYSAKRMIYVMADGTKVINNLGFFIDESMQGKGIGTKALANQVKVAVSKGYSMILLEASGERQSTHKGYYVWARLGFDGPLDKAYKFEKGSDYHIPEHDTAERVSDLMRTERGREWWKQNGGTWSGTFDLSPGSLSRRVLSNYLKEKGLDYGVTANAKSLSKQVHSRRQDVETPPVLSPQDEEILDRIWDNLDKLVENASLCGAGSEGAPGFEEGNTCAKGGTATKPVDYRSRRKRLFKSRLKAAKKKSNELSKVIDQISLVRHRPYNDPEWAKLREEREKLYEELENILKPTTLSLEDAEREVDFLKEVLSQRGQGNYPRVFSSLGTDMEVQRALQAQQDRIESWGEEEEPEDDFDYDYRYEDEEESYVETSKGKVVEFTSGFSYDSSSAQEAARKLNSGWSPDDYVAMTGIDDAESYIARPVAGGIQVDFEGPDDAYGGTRIAFKTSDGVKVLSNESFEVREDFQGLGTGTRMVANQVKWAIDNNFDYIQTYAVGSGEGADQGSKIQGSSGYYVWPRLGFDARIPMTFYNELSDNELNSMPNNAIMLSDLMKSTSGRKLWKKYGSSLPVRFDLEANSVSRKVLSEYLKMKGLNVGFTVNAKKAGEIETPPELDDEDERILDQIWDNLDNIVENESLCGAGSEGDPGFSEGNTCAAGGFENWFKGSKITDTLGVPIKVYHGTKSKDFTEFDPERRKPGFITKEYGIFFTPREKYAKAYGPNVVEGFVHVTNPKVVEGKYEISSRDLTEADVQNLIDQGYDGIVSGITKEDWDAGKRNFDEVVVFKSSQFKSVDNRGTYDRNDPNILNESLCGAGEEGSPGFQPGNTCATGDDSGFVEKGIRERAPERLKQLEKKRYVIADEAHSLAVREIHNILMIPADERSEDDWAAYDRHDLDRLRLLSESTNVMIQEEMERNTPYAVRLKEYRDIMEEIHSKQTEADNALHKALDRFNEEGGFNRPTNTSPNRPQLASLAKWDLDTLNSTYKLKVRPEQQEYLRNAYDKYSDLLNEVNDLNKAKYKYYYGEPDEVVSKPNGMPQTHAPELELMLREGSHYDGGALLGTGENFGGTSEEHQRFFNSARVYIQTRPPAVADILEDGQLKNAFAREASQYSVGMGTEHYMYRRSQVEEELFGIRKEEEWTARPIYGYWEHPDYANSRGAKVGSNYGTVQIRLKPEIYNRVTWTEADSFQVGRAYTAVDPPYVFKPGLTTEEWDNEPNYIEAQIHGGVGIDEIDAIRISDEDDIPDNVLEGLRKRGVKIETKPPLYRNY